MSDQPLRRVFATLATFFTLLVPMAAAEEHRADLFDFFVLSLSWSPTYCLSEEGRDNRQQCGISRRHGLVVHGLWPQYERDYPEFCTSGHPDRVPESLGRRFLDIMPSMGLVGHQWRKHGTCSGLSQEEYLETTRRAFAVVTVPDDLRARRRTTTLDPEQLENLFVAANPGLTNKGISVTCDGEKLEEIRICLTADLRFRECHQVNNNGCKAKNLIVPGIR